MMHCFLCPHEAGIDLENGLDVSVTDIPIISSDLLKTSNLTRHRPVYVAELTLAGVILSYN